MKKKSTLVAALMGIALLATPVLAGCQSNKIDWESLKTCNIESPDHVVVGDEFDLDDYVTLVGLEEVKDYRATVNVISEGVCSIEGHKVKVLREGNISIAIEVGPKGSDPLWKGKFSTSAITALKAQYADYTRDITNQFMFFEIEEDEKTGGAYAVEAVKHTPEYIWFNRWAVEDAKLKTYTSGGIMRCGNGHTHFYEIDSKHTNITVEAERLVDLSYYYVASDFNLPFSALKSASATDPTTGETQEYLTLEGTNPFVEDFVSYNVGVSWADGYTTHSLDIYPLVDVFGDGKTYWEIDINVAYSNQPGTSIGVGDALILSKEPEHCKDDLVEKYIADKSEPDAIAFDEIPAKFKAIEQAKNYTMTTKTKMYYTDRTLKQDVDFIGDDYDEAGYGWINGSVEVSKVDANNVATTFTAGGATSQTGYYNDGGKAYEYSEAKAGGFASKELAGVTDIWSSELATVGPAAADSVYKDFRVNSRTENKDGSIDFELGGDDVGAFLSKFLSTSVAGYGFVTFNKLYLDAKGETIWDAVDTYITVTPTSISVRVEILWEFLDEEKTKPLYISVESTISDIGSTTVALPEGVKAAA